MTCLLCFESNQVKDSIDIFGRSGRDLKIASIISKHFWFTPSQDDENKVICISCWLKVETFHSFYLSVEKAHTNINNVSIQIVEVKVEAEGDGGKPPKDRDSETSIDESFIHVESLLEQNWSVPDEQDDPIESKASPNTMLGNASLEHYRNEVEYNTNDDRSDGSQDSDDLDEKEEERKTMQKNTTKNSRIWHKSMEYDAFIQEHMKLACVMCSKPLPNFDELKKHFRYEHKRDGYAFCCNKRFTKRGILVDHIKVHLNPDSFKCELCGKNFAHRRTLKEHMDLHDDYSNNMSFNCEQCSKTFVTKKLLKRHQLIHMPEELKKFQCVDCLKFFGTNFALNNHRRISHEKVVNNQMCDICGKVLVGKASLRRHQLEHEGIEEEKPTIQCELCDIVLRSRFAHSRHMVSVHAGADEKKTCEICGKISPNAVAHKRHCYNIHRPNRHYQCTLCDKSFKNIVSLREHVASHTKTWLYMCQFCPSKFSSKSNMHTHRRKFHPQETDIHRKPKSSLEHTTDNKTLSDDSMKMEYDQSAEGLSPHQLFDTDRQDLEASF